MALYGLYLRALEDVEANTVRLKDVTGDDILVLERIEKPVSLHASSYDPSYSYVFMILYDAFYLCKSQLHYHGWTTGENTRVSTRDESG